jgi:pimeloyl-ACP methyl ester carboxylesterase
MSHNLAADVEVERMKSGSFVEPAGIVSDDVLLVQQAEPGSPLLIAFSSVNSNGFSFYQQAIGLKVHKVFVRDPADAWYQKGISPGIDDVAGLAAKLREIVAHLKPSRVVTVGASMGGYASLVFGNLIGADIVIASSPQTIIDSRLPHTPTHDFSGSETFDLKLWLEKRPTPPHWLFFGCADFVDIYNVSRVAWTNARLFPIADQDHLLMVELARSGDLLRALEAALWDRPFEPSVAIDKRGRDPIVLGLVERFVESFYRDGTHDPERMAMALRQIEPRWAAPFYVLSTLKAREKLWESAEKLAGKAASLARNSVTFANFHAQMLYNNQRYPDAKTALERCLKLRPKHYAALVTLAEVHAKLGEIEKSLERLDAAIAIRPRLQRARLLRDTIAKRAALPLEIELVTDDM